MINRMNKIALRRCEDNRTNLSDGPRDDKRGLLRVGQHSLGGVEETKVGGAVNDDALNGHVEPTVETDEAVAPERLHDAVAEAVEFSGARSLADIGGQPGSSVVQRVDEAERRSTSSTTRRELQVTNAKSVTQSFTNP